MILQDSTNFSLENHKIWSFIFGVKYIIQVLAFVRDIWIWRHVHVSNYVT